MSNVRLIHGDCLDVLPTLQSGSVDSLVTDPPAGIAFMGKEWDDAKLWQFPISDYGFSDQKFRHPAPNIGTSSRNPMCMKCHKHQRGSKRHVACSCEEPAFDTHRHHLKARDTFIAFLSAVMGECLRVLKPGAYGLVWAIPRTSHWTATALEDAGFEVRDRITHLFGQGFPKAKSCLKPAAEDWWLVRKTARTVAPLPGLDACRVDYQSEADKATATPQGRCVSKPGALAGKSQGFNAVVEHDRPPLIGRWPANVVIGDEETAALLDEQAGPSSVTGKRSERSRNAVVEGTAFGTNNHRSTEYPNETGGVSRFFYCPKASKADRGEDNTHPTVKPHALMRWLCRLITPPGGIVLDPFMGSGSTGKAAVAEGFGFIGSEKDANYFAIAEKRIAEARGPLFAEAR